MSLVIHKPGLLTSIQDMGRYGFRKDGVIVSGSMDSFASRTANLLVGNDPSAAVLEMTLHGAELQAQRPLLAAICGADMQACLNGERLPMWTPFVIPEGAELQFNYAVSGCRAYLAVAGGLSADQIMGSRSTYLRAGLGGHRGRTLRSGDTIELVDLHAGMMRVKKLFHQEETLPAIFGTYAAAKFSAAVSLRPRYTAAPQLRFIRSRETSLFTEESWTQLRTSNFRISSQSDRMGYRLIGDKPLLQNECSKEMISETVTPGVLQVPPDGQPILLMADCQTTGGYPRIGQVIAVDLPLAAQVKPGEALRFEEVSLRTAQELLLLQEADLRMLQAGVQARLV
ncbi:5-oxoprolinase subunit C family protein [Paenibacillus hexagrammi]|uniref:Biotin-dependent carboxyltransferase family protein n=1 Tax=Paenibacillus hexagrammi TaxID=2908839 RepID=A0ABY3SK63_9BACL|nr:biotin-dependent carboxyltransferase family protein [Paenibacillus sp. YPD9-1]UJF34439.1 biotin-dependent carboxyltransferase family protein [Paenibacillus sp. YPD9-1]